MTTQELFDKIANHLLTQNRKSFTDADPLRPVSCLYRHITEEGMHLSCAVGCLIDDAHYSWELEGESMECDVVRSAVQKSIGRQLYSEECALLEALQTMHDTEEPGDWPSSLKRIAREFRHILNDDESAKGAA